MFHNLILSVKPLGKSFSSQLIQKLIDMKTVTLQFPGLSALVKFKDFLQTDNIELNFTSLTLICECSEMEMQEAVAVYGAVIIHKEEGTQHKERIMV